MATTSRTVTVLTINGRRQNVKVEPNTTVLEVWKIRWFYSYRLDLNDCIF